MLAYVHHIPLILNPDHVWLVIVQGFAAHVKLNSEKLRDKFVKHDGKKTLEIEKLKPNFLF